MPKNNRIRSTVTRSISFDQDTFAEMEARREALRMSRSEFIAAMMEHILGILEHPELADLTRKARLTKPSAKVGVIQFPKKTK